MGLDLALAYQLTLEIHTKAVDQNVSSILIVLRTKRVYRADARILAQVLVHQTHFAKSSIMLHHVHVTVDFPVIHSDTVLLKVSNTPLIC